MALESTIGTANPPAADVYLAADNITGNTLRMTELTVNTDELGAGQHPGIRNIWYTLLLPNNADLIGRRSGHRSTPPSSSKPP